MTTPLPSNDVRASTHAHPVLGNPRVAWVTHGNHDRANGHDKQLGHTHEPGDPEGAKGTSRHTDRLGPAVDERPPISDPVVIQQFVELIRDVRVQRAREEAAAEATGRADVANVPARTPRRQQRARSRDVVSAGSLIRRGRQRRGLSQKVLAEQLGVTQSAVSLWEGDRVRLATAELAQRVERMLGIEDGQLVKACGYPVVESAPMTPEEAIEAAKEFSDEERSALLLVVDSMRRARPTRAGKRSPNPNAREPKG